MSANATFQTALGNLLIEIFNGPPGEAAYILNPGDPGLLQQLDTLDATAASTRPMPGATTIAAHADHVHFGLTLLNRWAAGEEKPVRDGGLGGELEAHDRHRRPVANAPR